MKSTLLFDNLEIRVFSLGSDEYICRIGRSGDQPEKVNDAFYPSEDLGYLWFRWIDGHLACSGIVSFKCPEPYELVQFIDREALRLGHQIDYQIDIVEKIETLIQSGEESLNFKVKK